MFALFTVALYCPEFLKPDAGSAKNLEADERLADVVGLVLDLGAVTLLTWGFCVVALRAWALGALAAWALGALALGPARSASRPSGCRFWPWPGRRPR